MGAMPSLSSSSSATSGAKTGDINPNVLGGGGNHGFSFSWKEPESISPATNSLGSMGMAAIGIAVMFMFIILAKKI